MSDPSNRSVTLPPDLDKSIEDAVAAGEFASPEQAIGEAVREWKERRENWGYTIAELRVEVQKGIDSGVAEPFSMEDVKAEGRRRLARRSDAAE